MSPLQYVITEEWEVLKQTLTEKNKSAIEPYGFLKEP